MAFWETIFMELKWTQLCYNASPKNNIIQVHYDKIHIDFPFLLVRENEGAKYLIVIMSVNKQFLYALSNRNFTIQREELTMTVVTTAFTSPLWAIVKSTNLLAMLSICLSLPFSANKTTKNYRGLH
jgi:hypothetical protein